MTVGELATMVIGSSKSKLSVQISARLFLMHTVSKSKVRHF